MKRLLLLILLFQTGVVFAQLQQPVKWSYAAKRINKHEAEVYMKATVASGWHIYGMEPTEGIVKTSFQFKSSSAYRLIGKVMAPRPVVKFDRMLKRNVSFYEGEVIFVQRLKLLKQSATIAGVLEFMVCSDKSCLPAEEIPFSIPVS